MLDNKNNITLYIREVAKRVILESQYPRDVDPSSVKLTVPYKTGIIATIQDIQDEFEVSRRTAIRMKDVIERLFPSMEEVENPMSRIKKWRLNKTPLNKMISFTAEEIAELEKELRQLESEGK